MRSSQADVVATVAVAVLAVDTAIAPSPVWATAVLGFALFVSCGYLLGQVLFGTRISGLERVVVCGGLALAVPVLGGVVLYFAGVLLHRAAWLGLMVGVTLTCDLVLYLRRRAGLGEPFEMPQVTWRGSPWHVVAFGAAVLLAAGGVAVAGEGVAHQSEPRFTQLWLSPERHDPRAGNLGVTNDQGAATQYRLVLLRRGKVSDAWNFTLADGQTWTRTVRLTGSYTITANLYRLPDLKQPYRYVSTGTEAVPGA
jgi:hypothetical protein